MLTLFWWISAYLIPAHQLVANLALVFATSAPTPQLEHWTGILAYHRKTRPLLDTDTTCRSCRFYWGSRIRTTTSLRARRASWRVDSHLNQNTAKMVHQKDWSDWKRHNWKAKLRSFRKSERQHCEALCLWKTTATNFSVFTHANTYLNSSNWNVRPLAFFFPRWSLCEPCQWHFGVSWEKN